jgi:hypothetical protein
MPHDLYAESERALTNTPVRLAGNVLKCPGDRKTELSTPKPRKRAEVRQLVAEFVSSGMRRSEFSSSIPSDSVDDGRTAPRRPSEQVAGWLGLLAYCLA